MFHRHEWILEGAQDVHVNDKFNNGLFLMTELLYSCYGCSRWKTEQVRGHFADVIIKSESKRN